MVAGSSPAGNVMSYNIKFKLLDYNFSNFKTINYYPFKKKGVFTMNMNMNTRNVVFSLATVGLFANGFVLIAGENLAPNAADFFNSIGFTLTALSIMLLALSQKTEKDADLERQDIYRDFDAVYRHIDDSVRDLRYELDSTTRRCSDSCKMKK